MNYLVIFNLVILKLVLQCYALLQKSQKKVKSCISKYSYSMHTSPLLIIISDCKSHKQ